VKNAVFASQAGEPRQVQHEQGAIGAALLPDATIELGGALRMVDSLVEEPGEIFPGQRWHDGLMIAPWRAR